MGAGATKKQVYRGKRRLLAGKQKELAAQGVRSTYRSNGDCSGVLEQGR